METKKKALCIIETELWEQFGKLDESELPQDLLIEPDEQTREQADKEIIELLT